MAVMSMPMSKRLMHQEQCAFTAMGSPCELFFVARSPAAARTLRERILDWLAKFEQQFSFYREESLISRINAASGERAVSIGPMAAELFALCDWFFWLTEGCFDPTSALLQRLWDYHDATLAIPGAEQIARAQALTGWSKVTHTATHCRLPLKGMAIDLGGIGKEYAVDKIMEMMAQAGIRDALINFGHDVRVMGRPPQGGAWAVGLEDPRDPGRCWAGISLDAGAVCTSGDYRRFRMIDGKRYGHIIDNRTGRPVDNGVLSVTVIAPTCTEAGICSTAAFVMGGTEGFEMLRRHFGVEGAIWTQSGLLKTPGFDRYVVSATHSKGKR